MKLDEITVIVPTRDETRNIPAFLRSLPPAVKLIAVDASRDETPELITALRPHSTQVLAQPRTIEVSTSGRINSLPFGSVAHARQIGAQAATTPWLLFTDADIIFSPRYFDRLEACQQCDVLYGPKLSLDEYVEYYRWFTRGQGLSHWLGVPAVSGSNLLVNRSAFEAVGGFDLDLPCNEDSELGWRIRRAGFRVEFAYGLVVYAIDHRRLRSGLARKSLHSVVRCFLLYLNLIPARWRSSDWGYWTPTRTSDAPLAGR